MNKTTAFRTRSRLIHVVLLILLVNFNILGQTAEFNPPALSAPGAWTMVLFPDTQNYVKYERNQPLLDLMAGWVVENRNKLNVQLALHVGDMVEQNALLNPDGLSGDQPGKLQWEAVARSMGKFDTKLPFIAATGNHDYGVTNIEYRRTEYERYFPVDKNYFSRQMLRDVAIEPDGTPTLVNATYEFIAPDDRKFLIMVLEFAPRDAVIQWARQTVDAEKYRDHSVILLTHAYLNRSSQHIQSENYPLTDRNYGAAIWEKLVKPSKNIRMVICGHIAAPDDPAAHVGFRTDNNAAGKKVYQMAFNAQALGGGWQGNGGDGWLRLLEFNGVKVTAMTFSPLFAVSPTTRHLAWGTGVYETFSFDLD